MNPNFKHIVKKLTLGSHKGGSPFPKTDWDKLYKSLLKTNGLDLSLNLSV